MPTDMTISYTQLEEPLDPDRQESLMQNMDDLTDSIRTIGLQQRLVVEDLGTGQFRVWAGHRRSIACTILQMTEIPVTAYPAGHADLEKIKQAENEQRNPLTDGEECRKYKRLWEQKGMGVEQIAAYLGTRPARVQSRLDLACGDEQVFSLLCEGKLSIAQAVQINKIEHGGYRIQAIELATQHAFGADALRRWYTDAKHKGAVDAVPDITVPGTTLIPAAYDPGTEPCQFTGHPVSYMESRLYRVCNEHYNTIIENFELRGEMMVIEQAGLLPHYKALVRQAERLLNDGGQLVQPGDATGSD